MISEYLTPEQASDMVLEMMVLDRLSPLAEYYDNPERFVRECFRWTEGQGPSAYQCEVLQELPARKRVALRCPHGAGKTAVAALIVLWFALTRDACGQGDWKIVMTASAWRQLSHYLAPEIHKWSRRLLWEKIGRNQFDGRTELLQLMLKLKRGEAFCAASDKPDLIEGAHADRLLYVFDEAKAIPAATWDAAEGALASGDCMALAISTPGEPQGRFYEIHSHKPGLEDWWTRHVTLEECIAAGRVSGEWAEQRKMQWGIDSAVYQNRVMGEFASSESDGIIPLLWVEAANERWRVIAEANSWDALTCVGVDIARYGSAITCLAVRHGSAIRELRRHAKRDTMETTGFVLAALAGQGAAVIDVIGVGSGVVDRLREIKKDDNDTFQIIAFNAGESTDWQDVSGEMNFVNCRAAAWWNLREMLDPSNNHNVALPPDDLLTGDLTAPHWRMTSTGRVQIESKEDIYKRLGRSTDDGDAVIQAFWFGAKASVEAYRYAVPRVGQTTGLRKTSPLAGSGLALRSQQRRFTR